MSRRASISGGDKDIKVATNPKRFWFSGKLVGWLCMVFEEWESVIQGANNLQNAFFNFAKI